MSTRSLFISHMTPASEKCSAVKYTMPIIARCCILPPPTSIPLRNHPNTGPSIIRVFSPTDSDTNRMARRFRFRYCFTSAATAGSSAVVGTWASLFHHAFRSFEWNFHTKYNLPLTSTSIIMAAPAKAAPIPSKLLKRITVGVTLSISSKAVANWESIASISECDCPVLSAPVSKRGRSNSSTAVRDPQANAGSTKPVIIVRTNCIRAYATSEIETNAMIVGIPCCRGLGFS
mmetsp:Transcript_76412/g.218809  ORF Transcript_76412/g.218809 Transcript_76412/m.218809 type:complete len:232 (+) Transcript_76412:326-1021(+)